MDDVRCNRIIAKFMGLDLSLFKDGHYVPINGEYPNYNESLDALIPVWEKLGITSHRCETRPENNYRGKAIRFTLYKRDLKLSRDLGVNIYIAAAHATSKAILELNKHATNSIIERN